MEKYLSIIKHTALFKNVEEKELSEMLSCLGANVKRYEKGNYIFRNGSITKELGVVLEGRVMIFQEDFWGNRNIISVLCKGDSFAESYACSGCVPLNVNVTAETQCSILFLNVECILNICPESCKHHHRVLQNLLSDIAKKNLSFSEKLLHLGQRTTREKLLSYLSEEAKKRNCSEFDIPFTRQQLADYLSVDRSGLSSELGKMKKEGMIDYNKNHFCMKQ